MTDIQLGETYTFPPYRSVYMAVKTRSGDVYLKDMSKSLPMVKGGRRDGKFGVPAEYIGYLVKGERLVRRDFQVSEVGEVIVWREEGTDFDISALVKCDYRKVVIDTKDISWNDKKYVPNRER